MIKFLSPLLLLFFSLVTSFSYAQDLPTSTWKDQADSAWYSDSEDLFILSTAEEVAGLSLLVSEGTTFEGKTIKLSADIDLDGHLWTPIGTDIAHSFKGNFDGENYTIHNLIVNQPEKDFAGLFGSVNSAHFINIHIDGAIVYGQGTVGGLVANLSTDSTIESCSVKNGYISSASGWVGGIAGGLTGGLLTRSRITKSSFSGEVHGGDQIGGLVGTAWDTTIIEESFSEGLVSGDNIVGGLVGFTTMNFPPNPSSRNYLKNSYSRAQVVATGSRAGGLYGSPETNGSIESCYSTGSVVAADQFGGSIGSLLYDTPVANTFWDLETSGLSVGIGNYTPGDDVSVVGKNTAEMKSDDFLQLLDNHQNLWVIDPEINDGYPVLAHQTLSVSENTHNNLEFVLFPTSTGDFIHVFGDKSGSYSIVDMTGKVLQTNNFQNKITVDVSGFQSGIYFFTLKSQKQQTTKRFIKI